jgi:hypothetical protein
MTVSRFVTALMALLLVMTLPALPDPNERGVLWDYAEGEGFRRAAVIGVDYLDLARLEKFYQERATAADRVFIIYAFENSLYAHYMLDGQGATDQEFGDWERRFRSVPNPGGLRMMQLVAIGKDVVIESVSQSRASRVMVRGRDPMLFESGGQKCQILEIYWSRPRVSLRKDRSIRLSVSIDLHVDRLPSTAEAKVITRELQRRLDHVDLEVDMRTDTWFIDDMQFPVWFPFAPDQRPPTFEEYVSKGRVGCIVDESGEISCLRNVR